MRINIQNVEEVIFANKDVWKRMPELIHLRDQWRMSKATPMLRALGKKSLLDFLRGAKGVHEDALTEHFGSHVTIDKIESHLVVNKEYEINEDFALEDADVFPGFSTYRTKDRLYVTFWR